MEKVKIHVLAGDCENKVSGPFWSTLNFVNSLIESGYDVILDASYTRKVSQDYLDVACSRTHFVKRVWPNGILSTYYHPSTVEDVDIVVSPFLFNMAFLYYVISNLFNTKKVCYLISIRGETYALNKVKVMYIKFLIFILGKNKVIHFLTQQEANLFLNKISFNLNHVVAGNGVINYPRFTPSFKRPIKYAVFSRIHPDKGVKRALELFGDELIVYGKASTSFENSFLCALKDNYPKEIFAGAVDSDQKFLTLKKIKFVIFLTKREGFPMLLLDALVAGCRLVTTEGANVPDDLKDFVLIVDPTIGRTALEKLMSNHKWDEKSAYDHVMKNYKAKQQTKKIIDKCLQY